MMWVDWALILAFVFGGLALFNMVLYRHGHKTTIEADLLLKQMRVSSRFYVALGIYRDFVFRWDQWHELVTSRWEDSRSAVKLRYGHDIGDLPDRPYLEEDVACLLVDIEENTL
jgi:hypothetical protein